MPRSGPFMIVRAQKWLTAETSLDISVVLEVVEPGFQSKGGIDFQQALLVWISLFNPAKGHLRHALLRFLKRKCEWRIKFKLNAR